jgi:superfamily I DNA/RNA helicase
MMGGLRFFSMDSSISEGSATEGIRSLADFAVLCRINRQMKVLEEAFQNHAIPYQTVGESPFFKQEPVKSLIDVLRLAVNDNPLLSNTVMKRKLIDEQRLRDLRELAGKTVSVSEMISAILTAVQLDVPEPHRRALIEFSDSFGTNVGRFLEQVLLGFGADGYNRQSERIALMTLHAAKGLEFACVFIAGCEQGLLPYSLFRQHPLDSEEERRLFYVGMTRAKRYLFLSFAKQRRVFGKEYHLARSPFLDPIEEELLELQKSQARRSASSAPKAQKQLDLF